MAKRIQKQKQAAQEEQAEVAAPTKGEPVDLSDLDALLDEIDGVLEQNAEAFVKNYVQKGGE